MKNIKIENMTIEDFEKIKDILISDFDDFWTPDILKSELIGDNKKYIVAKFADEIVGFAGVMINFTDLEIMNIVTKKSKRKMGIGSLLLKNIIEKFSKGDIENIFLEVNENNIIAIKLYEKMGFENIGKRKKYYNGNDGAIIMSKKVNNL